MAKLTLDDICNKSVEEILRQVSSPYIEAESVPVEDPEVEPPIDKKLVKEIKTLLTGFFAPDKAKLKAGVVLHVGNTFITVTCVLKSSGRAFFKIPNMKKHFSLPIWQLRGKRPAEKCKKGEIVMFNGAEHEVLLLNPASNSVQLRVNGRSTRVAVSRLTKKE